MAPRRDLAQLDPALAHVPLAPLAHPPARAPSPCLSSPHSILPRSNSLSLPPLSLPRGALGFGDADRRIWIPMVSPLLSLSLSPSSSSSSPPPPVPPLAAHTLRSYLAAAPRASGRAHSRPPGHAPRRLPWSCPRAPPWSGPRALPAAPRAPPRPRPCAPSPATPSRLRGSRAPGAQRVRACATVVARRSTLNLIHF
jgi:hypothetical protein